MLEAVRRLVARVVDPLRTDDEVESFTLSIPETATTTYDGGHGWHERPAAVLGCPECGEDVHQRRATATIDCAACWVNRPADEFSELPLRSLLCPRCENPMQFGRRHPEVFDVPEWATCDDCRYHWELNHWY